MMLTTSQPYFSMSFTIIIMMTSRPHFPMKFVPNKMSGIITSMAWSWRGHEITRIITTTSCPHFSMNYNLVPNNISSITTSSSDGNWGWYTAKRGNSSSYFNVRKFKKERSKIPWENGYKIIYIFLLEVETEVKVSSKLRIVLASDSGLVGMTNVSMGILPPLPTLLS